MADQIQFPTPAAGLPEQPKPEVITDPEMAQVSVPKPIAESIEAGVGTLILTVATEGDNYRVKEYAMADNEEHRADTLFVLGIHLHSLMARHPSMAQGFLQGMRERGEPVPEHECGGDCHCEEGTPE